MKNRSKRERYNRKRYMKKAAGLILMGVIFVAALLGYTFLLNAILGRETSDTLRKISAQNVLVVEKEIRGQLNALTEIAERVDDLNEGNLEKTIGMMCEVSERYPFKRMGIVFPDGVGYTTDGLTNDFSARRFFRRSMQGEYVISERLSDYFDQEDIMVFSAPVYREDEVAGVMFATYSTGILRNILSVSSFDGDTYIIDQEGTIMVAYREDGRQPSGRMNISEFVGQADDHNGNYVEYSGLSMNDWKLVSVISADYVNKTSNYIMTITYCLCILIIASFLLLLSLTIWEEQQKRRELEEILYVDPLTGGDTYQKFREQVREKLHGDLVQKEGKKAALLTLDLDNFKLINELFDYEQGNRVLCYLWRLLHDWVREEECFARRVADRFWAMVFYEDREELERRIRRLLAQVQKDNEEGEGRYLLRAKIGVYLVRNAEEEIENMYNYAVMAHTEAKKEGGAAYVIYTDELREATLRHKLLEDEMELAYKNAEYIIYYQPKYDTVQKKIIGAEALIRWKKPDGTIVPPNEFIPIAEKSGFIRKLDEYVFAHVCAQQKEWLRQGKKLVPVSVNLSRERLKDDSFIRTYHAIRESNQLHPSQVELEITESAIFENVRELIRIVDILHGLGFRILMDDFGTGYSSLMMLESVPVDVMKLDKSFVDDYKDFRGEKIISHVVQLAHSLDIAITAEGVETEEQYEFLKKLGCETIQGHYFAKPMPAEEFGSLLAG